MEGNLVIQERLREGFEERSTHHLLENKKGDDDLTQNSVIYEENDQWVTERSQTKTLKRGSLWECIIEKRHPLLHPMSRVTGR